MSALLKQDYVLTPRGNDIYPGTWTRGHRLPKKYTNITNFVNS